METMILGMPLYGYLIIAVVVEILILVYFSLRKNTQKEKQTKDQKRSQTEPEEEKPPKKPAVVRKPWPKKVKVGIVVLISVLGAVVAYRMFEIQLPDVQLPDVRISNAAFWVFFPIVILAGFLALSSNRKKALRVPLILFLGMLFVFWHFDVQILQMADRDGEVYGYNPMDFEPAGGLLDTMIVFDTRDPFWSPTGLHIPSNSKLMITAEGRFMWDPGVCPSLTGPEGAWPVNEVRRSDQFLLSNEPIVCLMGKIGNKIFSIGKATHFRVGKEGELQLAINERWQRHCWNDNSGTLVIRIKVS